MNRNVEATRSLVNSVMSTALFGLYSPALGVLGVGDYQALGAAPEHIEPTAIILIAPAIVLFCVFCSWDA